jgi:hypothetical protein
MECFFLFSSRSAPRVCVIGRDERAFEIMIGGEDVCGTCLLFFVRHAHVFFDEHVLPYLSIVKGTHTTTHHLAPPNKNIGVLDTTISTYHPIYLLVYH